MEKTEKEELIKYQKTLEDKCNAIKKDLEAVKNEYYSVSNKLRNIYRNDYSWLIGQYIKYGNLYIFVKNIDFSDWNDMYIIGPSFYMSDDFDNDGNMFFETHLRRETSVGAYITQQEQIKEISKDEFFKAYEKYYQESLKLMNDLINS